MTLAATGVESGWKTTAALAESSAIHVTAQVAFGIVTGLAVIKLGPWIGAVAGVATYVSLSAVVVMVPRGLSIATAIVLLLAGVVIPLPVSRSTSAPPRRTTTIIVCCAAAAIVLGTMSVSRALGPTAGGAVGAFPTMCVALAVAVIAESGNRAGGAVLTGMVKCLPCYFVFALSVSGLAPLIGPWSIPAGILTGLAAAALAWLIGTPSRIVSTVHVLNRRRLVPIRHSYPGQSSGMQRRGGPSGPSMPPQDRPSRSV